MVDCVTRGHQESICQRYGFSERPHVPSAWQPAPSGYQNCPPFVGREKENGFSPLADLKVSVEAGGCPASQGRPGSTQNQPRPHHAPTLIFTSFGASFFTSLSSLSPKPEWAGKENLKSILWVSGPSQIWKLPWQWDLRTKTNL